MRFGSVCSGIEAASAAWRGFGWEAAWFSEIEPFPSAVLAHHYPDVPNLGDMTTLPARILAGEVEAPDILVGGTPCQSFSVAGLRQGLADPRGQLTRTYVEILDALDAVRSVPALCVWENVPGVLSDKGNAFGNFLGALCGEDAALEPPGGKWTNAGLVLGPTRQVAWRVLDAQYFGVAQRRRRVFVVAGSPACRIRPSQVLLVEHGVSRHSPPSREAREVAPTIPSRSTGGGGLGTDFDLDGGLIRHDGGVGGVAIPLLDASKGRTDNRGSRDGSAIGDNGDPMFTLRAGSSHGVAHGGPHGRLDFESETFAVAYRTTGNDGAYDASEDGTGRGTPLVPVAFPIISDADRADSSAQTPSPDAEGRIRLRDPGLGIGDDGDPMFTLQATKPHAVGFYPTNRQPEFGNYEEVSPSVKVGSGGTAGNPPGVVQHMVVRRLTPVECERLQGFPDGWTDVPYRNKRAADGPRYKALGNSMAVPVMRWIGKKINAWALK
jgi:DNA (cytosine-5)-methyltransferase 1